MSFKLSSKKKKNNHSSFSPSVLGFAVAATVGAALGLLFAPKKGEDMREDILKEGKRLAVHFKENREEIQQKIKEVFGEVNEDLERAYVEMKSNILAASQILNDQSKLTQKKYQEIVQDVVKNFSKSKGCAKSHFDNFLKLLQKEELLLTKNKVKKNLKKNNSKVGKSLVPKKRSINKLKSKRIIPNQKRRNQ